MVRAKRGFTLVEMLVVIGIIAVLAAMLFPVFAAAREKGRSAACVSNLKQLGAAVEIYASDFDDHYPWAKDPADEYHPEIWNDFPVWKAWIPYMPRLRDTLDPYVKNYDVWHCASDTGFDYLEDTGLPMPAHPTSFDAFGTSYYYRTEIVFRTMLVGRADRPAEVNLLFDGHGRWHGRTDNEMGKRWNILYADGHVKTANRRQYDQAWATPL
jgi:general secretion pathway protein G